LPQLVVIIEYTSIWGDLKWPPKDWLLRWFCVGFTTLPDITRIFTYGPIVTQWENYKTWICVQWYMHWNIITYTLYIVDPPYYMHDRLCIKLDFDIDREVWYIGKEPIWNWSYILELRGSCAKYTCSAPLAIVYMQWVGGTLIMGKIWWVNISWTYIHIHIRHGEACYIAIYSTIAVSQTHISP
jgi:hypothetical protein